jgi:hypothetical protein
MPMPPPKASSEGPRDRQVVHEMTQMVRALKKHGAQQPDDLRTLVGGDFWDPHRFDRALAMSVADGLVTRAPDGRLQAN